MNFGTCKHFRGAMAPGAAVTGDRSHCCAKGINMRDLVGGPDEGWLTRLPCIRVYASGRHQVPQCGPMKVCALYEDPTIEEVAAFEREMQEHENSLMGVFRKIAEIKRGLKKGDRWSGTIECPKCKGKLHVSIAGCNHHARVRCETPDCVSYME